MTRGSLGELLMAVVRDNPDRLTTNAEPDEFSSANGEPLQLTNLLMRALLTDGRLEQFANRQGLVTAFRFLRSGKLFADGLWTLDRPSRSRQRNMRGCRNALEAALQARGDAHDMVDSYKYARCSLFYAGKGALGGDLQVAFEAWLFGQGTPAYFWGDLDHSGMRILAAMRSTFPDLMAWAPGYGPMVAALLAGGGHSPEAAEKLDQRQVVSAGCQYADRELIPALAQSGRCLDQELFSL